MEDNFYKNSLILIASNLATGILGFIFSINLSKELGAEGMGVYGLIMPIYSLFLCLICGGMVAAVSKEASKYFNKNDYSNLNKSINTALFFDLIWAVTIGFLVFFIAKYISLNVLRDKRTLYSLWAICPAFVFVGLSSILKGYFYGIGKVPIPAFIDIAEKAIRIIILNTIIVFFNLHDIKTTVTAAYIALAIGELLSFILLISYYKQPKVSEAPNVKITSKKLEARPQLLYNLLAISFPLSINGFVSTIFSTISTIIVPRRLVETGISYNTALAMIGKFNGMALSIVLFPIVIIMSITTLLIPDLTKHIGKKDFYALKKRIWQVLCLSLLIGLLTFFICVSIPDLLGLTFYSRTDLGSYIKAASISAPILFLASSTFGILNGLGKQGIILRNSLIVSIEELILLYIFTGIPSINVYGYAISLLITSLTLLILNLYETYNYLSKL
ncbi:MAG TPA: stage V sporulation protein B [Clostridiaceae bacterium]